MVNSSSSRFSGYRGGWPLAHWLSASGPRAHLLAAAERARAANGTLVMRMEDLDPDRSRQEYAQAALETCAGWEFVGRKAPTWRACAPYEQSGRLAIYLAAWRKLLRGGFLFPCRCSRKDLEAALSAPHESANAAQSSGMRSLWTTSRFIPAHAAPAATSPPFDSSAREIETPEGFHWRFRVPEGHAVEFEDRNLGPQRFVAGRDFGICRVAPRRGQATSLPAWPTTRPWASPRWCAARTCSSQPRGRFCSIARWLPESCMVPLPPDGGRQRPPLAKRHDALSLRALRMRG